VRIVLADDSIILREGLDRLLAEAGFDVAGHAATGEELLERVADLQPDVAIIDIRMPPSHTDEGLRAAREIHARWPAVATLVLSQHVRPNYAIELLSDRTEGVGYLLKDRVADLAELTDAINRVGAGGTVLDPSVVAQLVGRPRRAQNPLEHLSEREREVLAAMAEGRSNKAIGERLFITEHTVEKHIKSILTKLDIPATGDEHRRVLAVLRFLSE
jgi:DNA-binding NarL/FixJ family response regulator